MEQLTTKEGHQKLLDEKIKAEKELSGALFEMGEAAGQGGGWHENNFFEFLEEKVHHLKRRLSEINGQIRNSRITETTKPDTTKVSFGCTVELEINGESTTFKILGEADSNISGGIISHTSPIGKAVLGKKAGESVDADLPNGKTKVKILKIYC